MQVRKHHIDNLRTFDAAIIYKGKVNDQWVRMKVLDLLKAPGLGRNKPIKGKAVVMPAGSSINLETYKNHNLRILETAPAHTPESVLKILNEFEFS